MGSYVSVLRCESHYGLNITCDGNFNATKENNTLFAGDYPKGAVPGDPDVAGVGVSVPPTSRATSY